MTEICTLREGSALTFNAQALDFEEHASAVTDEPLIGVNIVVELEGHRYQLPVWTIDPATLNDLIARMTTEMKRAAESKLRHLRTLSPRPLPDGFLSKTL